MNATSEQKLVARAAALSKSADPQAFPELAALTRSTSPLVRGAAASAIGKIADTVSPTAGVQTIQPLLEDAHSRVRQKAAAALGVFGAHAEPALEDLRALYRNPAEKEFVKRSVLLAGKTIREAMRTADEQSAPQSSKSSMSSPSSPSPGSTNDRAAKDSFIPPHGGYKKLKSYQKSLVIFQGTKYFCKRFFSSDPRQTSQMVQAARSGKQNIAEGSLAAATSKQSEIHLTNVAKASLGELQEDYEDFLRDKKLPTWDKDHPQARQLSKLSRQTPEETYEAYKSWIEHPSPEIAANALRHLIIQATVILARQIQRLEREFLEQGGIRERMTAARLKRRTESRQPDTGETSHTPKCPECHGQMVRHTARRGPNAGNDFWGCARYPDCKGTRPVENTGPGRGH